MEIYIHKDSNSVGPYSLDQLQDALDRGDIALSDQAWHAGLQGWTQLHTIIGKAEPATSAATPPVPYLSPRGRSASRQPQIHRSSFDWLRKAGGCTGSCSILILLATIGLIGIWFADRDETNRAVSINNGIASIVVNQEGYVNGDLNDHGTYLGLAVERVAGTVWETAHDHPDIHAVIIHLNMKYPREVSRDRYGNETSHGGEWVHLCDVEIDDLITVRRYQDAEAYSVLDHDIEYFYQQKIEPSFRQYRAHINNGVY